MYLLKIGFAVFSIGGASYALYRAEESPLWVKLTCVTMAVAALIIALSELPKELDALADVGKRIDRMLPSLHSVYASAAPGYPSYCGTEPNGSIRCCNDTTRRLTLVYFGNDSPYITSKFYWVKCY